MTVNMTKLLSKIIRQAVPLVLLLSLTMKTRQAVHC
jgi:hypothetical protein